jgi:hypothetical protein
VQTRQSHHRHPSMFSRRKVDADKVGLLVVGAFRAIAIGTGWSCSGTTDEPPHHQSDRSGAIEHPEVVVPDKEMSPADVANSLLPDTPASPPGIRSHCQTPESRRMTRHRRLCLVGDDIVTQRVAAARRPLSSDQPARVRKRRNSRRPARLIALRAAPPPIRRVPIGPIVPC